MVATKTTMLTLRIDAGLKEALRAAAVREHRSITNMVEVLIRDHCGQNGITILEPGTQIDGAREIATDGKKDD